MSSTNITSFFWILRFASEWRFFLMNTRIEYKCDWHKIRERKHFFYIFKHKTNWRIHFFFVIRTHANTVICGLDPRIHLSSSYAHTLTLSFAGLTRESIKYGLDIRVKHEYDFLFWILHFASEWRFFLMNMQIETNCDWHKTHERKYFPTFPKIEQTEANRIIFFLS